MLRKLTLSWIMWRCHRLKPPTGVRYKNWMTCSSICITLSRWVQAEDPFPDYRCNLFSLLFKQFAPIIKTDSLVHHMEVFHCDTDPNIKIPLYNGDCKDMPAEGKVCSKVMALWAMGAGTFTYPAEAGLPIGGKNFNPFIRLEAHFNNPDLIAGNNRDIILL